MRLSSILIAMLPLVVTSERGDNALRGTTNATLYPTDRNGNSSSLSLRALGAGTCGGGNIGNGICPDSTLCCSKYGYCGTGSSYCSGGSCGGGNIGNGICPDSTLCCSKYGYCGTGSSYCSGSCGGGNIGNGICSDSTLCCSKYGYCGTGSSYCSGSCGGGNIGNGICSDSTLCCSKYGYCGTGSSYCSGSPNPPPTPSAPPPTSPGSSNVLYSGSGSGTYYYDVTGKTCNGAAPYPENNGYPECTSFDLSKAKTVQQYNTNNIVAIDNTLLSTPAGRANLCGKQIHVYKNGVEVSGGPFVVFDGCAACVGGGRIDFSVSALNAIDNGNACNDGVVPGISWKVTNNQIIPFVP